MHDDHDDHPEWRSSESPYAWETDARALDDYPARHSAEEVPDDLEWREAEPPDPAPSRDAWPHAVPFDSPYALSDGEPSEAGWPYAAPADTALSDGEPSEAGWPYAAPSDAAWPDGAPLDIAPADTAWPYAAPSGAAWPEPIPADAAVPEPDAPEITALTSEVAESEEPEEPPAELFIEDPTVEIAPRRPLDPSVNVDEIEHQYGRARHGPVHRFAVWASGADRVVLDYARVEETEHVVQGTLVTFTAAVAAIAGMAAGSFLIYGRFAVTVASVVIGLLWGTGIFVLDRALVSSTYNPYRFGRDEVETLTELHGTAPWEHVLTRLRVSQRAQRARDMLRILSFGTALRIALAIATSYIVAEMALFLIFEPEVNLRTQYLQNQERTQQISEINARYEKSSGDDAARRALLTGDNDPEVTRLTGELSNLDKRLDDARHDFGILSAAAAAELNGDPYSGRLSDGTVVETTGRPGNGAAAKSLADRRDNQRAIVDDLTARQASTRDALAKAREAFRVANADALAELDRKTGNESGQRNSEIAEVTNEPPLKGLLRRQAALDLLTYDTNPATLQSDPIPPCTGFFTPLCKLRNWIWPPTPMGPTVIALRTIFLVIELMPISFKILQSIRPRRPYDVAKAALEHASMLRSYRMLDAALHDVSLDMVGQSAKARQAYQRYGRTPRARQPTHDSLNGSGGG
jgi:hypothetical protein